MMSAVPANAFAHLALLVEGMAGVRKAVTYIDKKTTIKVARRHKEDKRRKRTELLFTFGAPNYKEKLRTKQLSVADFPYTEITQWYK